ncbi:MAG TPA: pitrilysin family protein [Candidatus Polarisedimenticolaceae bacterium]
MFRALVSLTLAAAAGLAGARAADVDIPFQKFVLDNGLTLLVHEDPKAPIVAVNVWYHVGSKNEKPGRTGFAHLFEHLMFNGSENYDDDYFKATEVLGATDLNGTTNEDRTNYFQNVPKNAVDRILWLESDRMGHLIGAIDQERLDEQRGVVQNEKRQYENEPYTLADDLITKAVWPAGHPYSWTVIGSMEDLSAARLEDVHAWFRSYYGAANATIVVAGDIKAADALERVKKYFGDVPPGPPVSRHRTWIAKRSGTQRQTAEDRVPAARVLKVWNVTPTGWADTDHLDLIAKVLASGKNSRLYKRLVYDERLASSVQAFVDDREIASLFRIEATASPGGSLAAVEKALDEELARLLEEGPTAAEVERARAQTIAGFVRGIERIGGFGGKSDILARSQVFLGSPDAWKQGYERVRTATPADLAGAARRWLADGAYVLEIHPFPERTAAATGADRSKLPDPGATPAATFPKIQRAKLSNGLSIALVERRAIPVVEMDLILDAGYAADRADLTGTAALALDMLDEGTKTRSSLEISDQLQRLGATLGTGSALDTSNVSMSALKANLDASLDLFADVVLNPAFPPSDFERLRAQRLAQIRQEKAEPVSMAIRVMPPLMYGAGHSYGVPLTGSGYESTVAKMTRDDLAAWHKAWFQPDRATLVVVGDTSLAELQPKLEARLKDWKPGKAPAKSVAAVPARRGTTIYVVDRPGSIQSVILAGQLAPAKANPDEVALQTMQTILGGGFISRINLNLREDKHWSYGAGGFLLDARAQRPYIFFAPVQADKTKESMQELLEEIRGIRGGRPVTPEELQGAKDQMTLTLAGQWETNDAVAGSLVELVSFGLPDDYVTTFPAKVRALGAADVPAVATKTLRPDDLLWVVVGDRARIEPKLAELGWGEIRFVDADGRPVK